MELYFAPLRWFLLYAAVVFFFYGALIWIGTQVKQRSPNLRGLPGAPFLLAGALLLAGIATVILAHHLPAKFDEQANAHFEDARSETGLAIRKAVLAELSLGDANAEEVYRALNQERARLLSESEGDEDDRRREQSYDGFIGQLVHEPGSKELRTKEVLEQAEEIFNGTEANGGLAVRLILRTATNARKPGAGESAPEGGRETDSNDHLAAHIKEFVTNLDRADRSPKALLAGLTNWSDKTDAKAQFLDRIDRQLRRNLSGKPGARKVLFAVLERTIKSFDPFIRAKERLFGSYIQLATYGLFFFGIALLGARASLLFLQWRVDDEFGKWLGDGANGHDSLRRGPNGALTCETLLNTTFSKEDEVTQQRAFGESTLLDAFRKRLDSESKGTWYFKALALAEGWRILAAAKTLSARDAERAAESVSHLCEREENRLERVEYSWIDYVLWAMPSLGFIGTVLGIGEALGDADRVVRATDALQQAEAITGVTSLLGIAFDTTLVALVCSLFMMVVVHILRARESGFLLDVQTEFDEYVVRWTQAVPDGDKKAEDNKTEDNKTEDNKTEDNKTEDNKTEDNKTGDSKTEAAATRPEPEPSPAPAEGEQPND